LLIEPIIKEKRMVLPIYRSEEEKGYFNGDGFFYSSPDKLDWKVGMSGNDMSATPDNLLDSYKMFKDEKTTIEEALILATKELKEWYNKLISGDYFLPGERK
jgi:hypothetical protein